jgi:hypothetical protein
MACAFETHRGRLLFLSFGPSPGSRGLLRPLLTSRSGSSRRPFRHKARSPQVRTHSFTARPPDLRRLALVTRASRSFARSPCSAPPSIRFLFIGPQLRSTLPSHGRSPSCSCASLRSHRREDKKYGADKRGDELPEELARRETRLAKIIEAKKALEEEAKRNKHNDDPPASGPLRAKVKSEKNGKRGKETPPDTAQRNFTDPHSRIMPYQKTFIQGYNAQVVVDSGHQIIVATDVTNSPKDDTKLKYMITRLPRKPKVITLDAGYASKENIAYLKKRKIDAYIADSLFRRFAVEVLVVGLRVGAGMVDNAVPMIRRRIERVELQRNSAGIDDVVIRPGRDDYREARSDRRPNAIENRLTGPLLHAKELVELVDFRIPISSLGFNAMRTSWQFFAV